MKTIAAIVTILTSVLFSTGPSEASPLHLNDILSSPSLREGGGAVGNGGGVILCPPSSNNPVELLDYFEARKLRNISIDIDSMSGTWKEKAQAVINRLGKQSQLRQKIYSSWLATFENEMMILAGVEFNTVPDAMNIGIPEGCKYAQAAVQISPQFSGDRRYYISESIWKQMSESQKAGLVLHEIVYREALSYGHSNSVATRYFVGLISSAKIAAMSFPQFFATLVQVKFEQTDMPLSEPTLKGTKTVFNPIEWWRGEGADHEYPASDVVLNDAILANVGVCTGVGCETFKPISILWDTWPRTGGRFCNGVRSIELPNGDLIEIPEVSSVEKCSTTTSWFGGTYTNTNVPPIPQSTTFDISSDRILKIVQAGETFRAQALWFNFKDGYHLEQLDTKWTENNILNYGPSYSVNDSCKMTLKFENHQVIEAMKSATEPKDGQVDGMCSSDFQFTLDQFSFSTLLQTRDLFGITLNSGLQEGLKSLLRRTYLKREFYTVAECSGLV